MKLCYLGTTAVDIPGRDGVEPLEVIEVPDELGRSLLTAGTSISAPDAAGAVTVIAARAPKWREVDSTISDAKAGDGAVDAVIPATGLVPAATAKKNNKRQAAVPDIVESAAAEKES